MGTRNISLRVGAWFGERELELAFPTHWEVTECVMGGHDRPALSEAALRAALQTPIGSPPHTAETPRKHPPCPTAAHRAKRMTAVPCGSPRGRRS